jgi:hypothetical protein
VALTSSQTYLAIYMRADVVYKPAKSKQSQTLGENSPNLVTLSE